MAKRSDWRSEEGIAAWSAFLRAHATTVRAVDRDVVAATGLPLGWYDVLLELNAAPQRRLRMHELGVVAVLSRSRVSRVVDDLVAAGFVCRERNPQDRRSSYASITQAGRGALRSAAPVYLEAIRRHFVRPIPSDALSSVRVALEAVVMANASPSN